MNAHTACTRCMHVISGDSIEFTHAHECAGTWVDVFTATGSGSILTCAVYSDVELTSCTGGRNVAISIRIITFHLLTRTRGNRASQLIPVAHTHR